MTEIYCIEDDENIAVAVKEYLGRKGYSVSVFATLECAGRALESRLPGIVLVGWNMPDGEGGVPSAGGYAPNGRKRLLRCDLNELLHAKLFNRMRNLTFSVPCATIF